MSDTLWPHGLQHSRLLCPPLSPRVCSNSCPLSHWCYQTISSAPFSFCFQSFSTSGSSLNGLPLCIRWPKRRSLSSSIRLSDEYSGLISFRIDWSPCYPRDFKSLLHHHSSEASVLQCSALVVVQLSHLYMTAGKASFDSMDRNTMWRGIKAGLRAPRRLDDNFGIHHWKERRRAIRASGLPFQSSPQMTI